MKRALARFPSRRSSWIVVGAWLVLAGVFGPLGAKVAGITNDEYVLPGSSQTSRLHKTLAERFPGGDLRPALIVYRRPGGLTSEDERRIEGDARVVAGLEHVARPAVPFGPDAQPGLVSRSGEVAVTVVPLEVGEIFHVTPSIEAIRDHVDQGGGPEVHVTGWPALISDYNTAIKEADFKLLGATVALVFLLLIAVYRSPILAVVPLFVVGLAYAIVIGIVYVLNRAIDLPVDNSSTSLLLVLMFGAGTDYCLLLVSRYGASLRRTESAGDAVREALPGAAPPILASGATVIAALLTTLAGVFGPYRTFGPITALGVALVLLASLTLLPAMLALLGRRAYWPNTASVAPGAGGDAEERPSRWRAIGARVRRRPVVYFAASLAFLMVGVGGLGFLKTHVDPLKVFRGENDSVQGYEVLRSSFPPGAVSPTSILVDRSTGPVTESYLATVSSRVRSLDGVATVVDTGRRSTDGRAALLNVVYDQSPYSGRALDLTERLRSVAAAAIPDGNALVGEGSGERLDARNAQIRDTKIVIPLVLIVVLLTLIVLLRALVAPLFLLATVIVSFAATLGFTVLFFRFVLGQESYNEVLTLIVFIFLVALGSDYNIFLMSRVREEAARYGTREGTLNALAATGPVITSAGLILAGTFFVLMIIPSWDLTFAGFAIAFGVLLDTFLVRSICVPALTWLVGEKSWWPSSAEKGDRAAVVTGVYTTEQLLGVKYRSARSAAGRESSGESSR